MKKLSLKEQCQLLLATLCVLLATAGSALGQSERPNRREILEGLGGEAELFGSQLRFLGSAASRRVVVTSTCDSLDVFPGDVCIVQNPPQGRTGSFTQGDLGHVTLPGSAKDALVFICPSNIEYGLGNSTDMQLSALFRFQALVDIESDALRDPRAVDEDGNPVNGVLPYSLGIGTSNAISKTLAVGESITLGTRGLTRVSVFSKSSFVGPGLPADIVDRMFRGPMTIRLRVTGFGTLGGGGSMTFLVRVFAL